MTRYLRLSHWSIEKADWPDPSGGCECLRLAFGSHLETSNWEKLEANQLPVVSLSPSHLFLQPLELSPQSPSKVLLYNLSTISISLRIAFLRYISKCLCMKLEATPITTPIHNKYKRTADVARISVFPCLHAELADAGEDLNRVISMASTNHELEFSVKDSLLAPIAGDPCGAGKEVGEQSCNLDLSPYILDVPITVRARKKHTYIWECVSFSTIQPYFS